MPTDTWVSGVNGDWSNAADWSGGVPNDPAAIVAISAPGAYTVTIGSAEGFSVGSLSLAGSDATLRIDGTLAASGTVTVTHGSGLYLDGTLSGGTIADTTGGISYAGGTLSGVSSQGTLDMSSDNSTLTITGPASFVGSGGSGAGTINLAEPSSGYGVSSLLNIAGTDTLNNVNIDIGNSRFAAPVTTLENLDTSGTGAVLTLGSSCTILQEGGYAALSSSGFAGDMIVNDGTINAAYAGGHLYIDADFFTNNGTMSVSNGAFIDLSGNISAALVNSIHKSGGTVAIDGTVTGGTITAPSGGVDGFGGTLSGVSYQGTLDMSSDDSTLTITGPTSFAGAGGNGAGTIDLAEPSSGYGVSSLLNIAGTDTLNNVTIDIGNSRFAAPVTTLENLDTSGTGAVLTLGPSCAVVQAGGYAALSSSGFAGDMIVNDGTINAAYAGGHLYIDADFFSNNGTMSVSNGAFIDLSGNISADLVNSIHKSGGTVAIDGTVTGGTITAPSGGVDGFGGTLSGVSYQGTLNMSLDNSTLTLTGGTSFAGAGGKGHGTINLSEPSSGYGVSSLLNIAGTATLNNVTIDIGNSRFAAPVTALKNLDTTGQGAVLTLGSSCTITQTGAYAALSSSGLSGDMIVNDGKIVSAYAGGHFEIDADFFTNNGSISVSDGAFIDLSGGITAALVNSIEKSGGIVAIDGTVTGGTISAPNGGVGGFGGTLSGVSYRGTLDLSSDNSTLTLTNGTHFAGADGKGSGTIDLSDPSSGYGVSSALQVLGNQTLNNVTIDIGNSGFAAAPQSIVNLDAGTGAVLTLGSKTTIDQTGARAALTSSNLFGDKIINDGTVTAGYAGGSLWIEVGKFQNAGLITASNGETITFQSGENGISQVLTNTGTISADGGSVDLTGAVSGTGGVLAIQNGGILQLQGSATSSQSIAFGAGSNTLILDALATMKSVVTGFAAGDTIDLAGVIATSKSYAAGKLTLLDGKTVLGKIDLPGSFTSSSFTLTSDGNNGTDIQLKSSASSALPVPHATMTAHDFGLEPAAFDSGPASGIADGAFQRSVLPDHGLWPEIMHSLALRAL